MLRALCFASLFASSLPAQSSPPPVPREFRGVWIATVGNAQWPSRPGLPVWQQQQELLAMLNRAVELRLNAVILQVRPATDAFYASPLEPWSEYLTGDMGRAPEPFYDPLAFAVAEAHRRGLELHAWFNPYRAHPPSRTPVDWATTHVSRAHPELVRQYGQYLWMDPGDPAVARRSLAVILDVVRRYDVDGVHVDDYFYPYAERDSATNAVLDFPDSATYARYVRESERAHRTPLARGDWRRQNVDRFVERMYREVKGAKPWVKVGVSPFGIWRPGYPDSVRGMDPYTELYADSRKWLANGWLDYFSPQLYWAPNAPGHPFGPLLAWWASQNGKRRHLWPGLAPFHVDDGGPGTMTATELLDELRGTRIVSGSTGAVHYHINTLMRNQGGVADSMRLDLYAEPALVPASRWLDSVPPLRPIARVRHDTVAGGLTLALAPRGTERVWLWTVRARWGDRWTTAILPAEQRAYTLTRSDSAAAPDLVVVTAVDRVGNESAAVTLPVRPPATARASGPAPSGARAPE